MKVAIFSIHEFEKPFLEQANNNQFDFHFFEERLTIKTAILAKDFKAVSIFTSDEANATVLEILSQNGTEVLVLRSAGYNHVDLKAAKKLGSMSIFNGVRMGN